MRRRESFGLPRASSTSPCVLRTRRCLLIAGGLSEHAAAISPAGRGRWRSRSMTPRRVGSARAARVRSTWGLLIRVIGIAVHLLFALVSPLLLGFGKRAPENPAMAFRVNCAIGPAAIGLLLSFGYYDSAHLPGLLVMSIDL